MRVTADVLLLVTGGADYAAQSQAYDHLALGHIEASNNGLLYSVCDDVCILALLFIKLL